MAVGGIGQFVHDISIALRRRGFSVTAMYRYETPEFEASDKFLGSARLIEIRPWNFPGLRTISVNLQTGSWIRRHRDEFDVLHVLNPMPMAASALRAGHRFNIPSVVTIYAKYPLSPNRLLRIVNERAQRILLREADLLVYESANTMREFVPHVGRVILNGIDPGYFRPRSDLRSKLRESLGIGIDDFVILFLGRLDRLKGIYVFLEAIAALRERRKDFRALLVGSVEVSGIPELIKQHGIDDVTRLVGPAGKLDVLDYYCASDVFVLPSFLEGISSALIEAMACGLPVVATSVGGNTEVVHDGVDGILFPPGDVRTLSKCLEDLLDHRDRGHLLGTRARNRIEEQFNLDSMTDAYVQAYEQVVSSA
jgi:glycosyltransferase involved in cell wall biosynthesis